MKKMKVILGLITVICLSTALSFGTGFSKSDQEASDLLFSSIEALGQNESGGTVIKCYCQAWYQGERRRCTVDGGDTSAGPCAQSQPGGNINCSDYNDNCR